MRHDYLDPTTRGCALGSVLALLILVLACWAFGGWILRLVGTVAALLVTVGLALGAEGRL